MKAKIELEDDISAPIKKGEKLGTISYEIDGKEYKTDLVANNKVDRSYTFLIYIVIIVIIFVSVAFVVNSKIKSNREEF